MFNKLYSAVYCEPNPILKTKGRGGSLTFNEVCFVTECVKEYALMSYQPIAGAISDLQRKRGALTYMYRAAKRHTDLSAKQVAKELLIKK